MNKNKKSPKGIDMALLGGSWVVMISVLSTRSRVESLVATLIPQLITTHEPASTCYVESVSPRLSMEDVAATCTDLGKVLKCLKL